MKKNITLRNDFHNTTITLRAEVIGSSSLHISFSQAKKAQKTLCGVKGCQCSDDMGCRGNQDFQYSSGNHNGFYLFMNDNKN